MPLCSMLMVYLSSMLTFAKYDIVMHVDDAQVPFSSVSVICLASIVSNTCSVYQNTDVIQYSFIQSATGADIFKHQSTIGWGGQRYRYIVSVSSTVIT